jgi:glutamine cyclotransferase
MKTTRKSKSKAEQAEVLREYGPYPGMDHIHGVTFDGMQIWFARGESIVALDPQSGALVRELPVAAEAGTAFDGKYLWQIADDRIQKVDPNSGKIVATIPAPAHGRDSGLTWAEGTLWVGEYRARKIHQIDAQTGAILRTIESDRFVTGVSWVNGELWHGTLEEEQSEIRRVNPETGEVLERLEMPAGVTVSGLEADGAGVFYCGGSNSGKVRSVRKTNKATANKRE